WNPAAFTPTSVDEPQAIVLPTGSVFVFGSFGINQGIAPVQVYDPVADKWSIVARSQAGRLRNTTTLLANGKVLVVGGQSTQSFSTFLASAEIYDPATDKWSPTADMP